MPDIDLHERFPDLRPLRSPPALFSVNGFGLCLVGRRDRDAETSTYVKTRALCLLFVPVIAIDAYRVGDARGGGWFVLGRQPLSAFAKVWNLLLACVLVSGGATAAWNGYTSSPAYRDGQRLAAARTAAAAGRLGEAAQVQVDLIGSASPRQGEAALALTAVVRDQLPAAPAGEQAGVLRALARLDREARTPVAGDAQVTALAEAAAAGGEPLAALAVVDAARGLLAPSTALAATRAQVLARLHQAQPGEPRWAIELAELAADAGDQARCLALLEPHAARLGDGPGARILGQLYASQGKAEESHRLLSAYCTGRLKTLHAAEKAYAAAVEAASRRALDALNAGAGGASFRREYDALDEAGKEAKVDAWIAARMKEDRALAAVRERLRAAAEVVPVALDLGIVSVQRAAALPDPAARSAELTKAEQVFLAIRGLAGESDAYRLFLGQVCYWLGKAAQGRELFDALLAARQRSPEVLLEVAGTLRAVGDHAAARALCEEAHGKAASDDHRHRAAGLRSVLFTDTEDRARWLGRCDQKLPQVRASLASVQGDLALRAGKEAEAERAATARRWRNGTRCRAR